MNRLLRTFLFAAAGVGLLAAGFAFLARPTIWADLGMPEPSFGQKLAPVGGAFLAVVVAVLLKQTRKVEYHSVVFHDDAPPPRIAKASARPKIGKKLKKQVRANAAARVRAASRR